jgi:hypothetical protein
MSIFPGAVFNAEGTSLDPAIPDLTQETLDEYQHRSMVARDRAAPIARVWLLADDATPDAIPSIWDWEALIGFRGGEVRAGQLGWEHLVREQKRE